jgi:hypothetical protein
LFGLIDLLTGALIGLIEGLGWTAPLVAALVFVVLLEGAEEFGGPLATALSDLLGAIPVVGSVLDFFATLLIELLGRLGGD